MVEFVVIFILFIFFTINDEIPIIKYFRKIKYIEYPDSSSHLIKLYSHFNLQYSMEPVLGLDGITTSMVVSLNKLWELVKPGVMQSMGSQRVRHNWVTELNLGPLRVNLTKQIWIIYEISPLFLFCWKCFFFDKCCILSNALSAFIHMFIYFSLYFNMENNSD